MSIEDHNGIEQAEFNFYEELEKIKSLPYQKYKFKAFELYSQYMDRYGKLYIEEYVNDLTKDFADVKDIQ